MKWLQTDKPSFYKGIARTTANFYKQRLYNTLNIFQRNKTFSYIVVVCKFFLILVPIISVQELFDFFKIKENNFSHFEDINFKKYLTGNHDSSLQTLQIIILSLHIIMLIYLIVQYFIYLHSQSEVEERKKKPLEIKSLTNNLTHNNLIQIPKHDQQSNLIILLFSMTFKIHQDIIMIPSILFSSMEYNPISITSIALVLIIGIVSVDLDYDYLISSDDWLAKRFSKTNYITFIILAYMAGFSQYMNSIRNLTLLSSIVCLIIFIFQIIWRPYINTTIRKMVQFGYLYISMISIALYICFTANITSFYCLVVMILIPITYRVILFLEDVHEVYLNSRIFILKQILLHKDKSSAEQIHPFEIDEIMRVIFQDLSEQNNQNITPLLQQYYLVFQENEENAILQGQKKYFVKEEMINGELYVKKEQAFGKDELLKESLKEIFKKIFKFLLNQPSINQEKKTDIRFYYLIFLLQIQKIPQQFMMQAFIRDKEHNSIKDEQMIEVLLNKFTQQLEDEQRIEGNTFSYFNNSFLLPILFEQITLETAALLDKAINFKLNLLYMMTNKYIDLQILNQKLQQIYQLRNRIIQNLNSLASMNQISDELHYLYTNFLENLSFSEKDVKINYQQKQLNYIQKNFFCENTGVLFVSVQKERQSIIKKASLPFCSMFEVTEQEIINTEIDRLIPLPIQQKHRIYVQRFLENPNLIQQNIYKDLLFGTTKNGYIFPCEMNLRLTQYIQGSEYSDDFGITAFIKGIQNNSEYILYEHSKKNRIISLTRNLHQKIFPHIKDIKRIEIRKFFPFLKNKNSIRSLFTYEKSLKTFHHTISNGSSQLIKQNTTASNYMNNNNNNNFRTYQTLAAMKNGNSMEMDGNLFSQGKNSEPALSSRYPQSFHSQYENFTTYFDDEDDQKQENSSLEEETDEDFPQDFTFILIVEKPQSQFAPIKQKPPPVNSIQNLYAQVNQQPQLATNYQFFSMRINVMPFRNRKLNLNYLEIFSVTEINPQTNTQIILPLISNNDIAEIKTNRYSLNQIEIDRLVYELQSNQNNQLAQKQQSPASSISEVSDEQDEAITPQVYRQRKQSDQLKSKNNNHNNTNNQIIHLNHFELQDSLAQNSVSYKIKSKNNMEEVVEAGEENENDLALNNQDHGSGKDDEKDLQEIGGNHNLELHSNILYSPHNIYSANFLSTNRLQLIQSPKTFNMFSEQDLNNDYEQIYSNNKLPDNNDKNGTLITNNQTITQIKVLDDQQLNNHSNSQSYIHSFSQMKVSTGLSRNKHNSNNSYADQSHNAFVKQQKFYSQQFKSEIDGHVISDQKTTYQKGQDNQIEDKDLQEALEVSSTHSRSSNLSSTKKNLKRIIKTKKSLFIMKVISFVGFCCVCSIIAVTIQQYYQILSIFNDQIEDFKFFDWPMAIQSEMSLIQKNENFQKLIGSRNQLPITQDDPNLLIQISNDEMTDAYTNIIYLLSQMSSPPKQLKIFSFIRETPSNFTFVPSRGRNNNFNRTNCTTGGSSGGNSTGGGKGGGGKNNCSNSTGSGGSGGWNMFNLMINQTYNLDYSLLLLSQTIFNYAFMNETLGTSERGFLTNINFIKDQLNKVYYQSKEQMFDQLNSSQRMLDQLMIVIMVVIAGCLIVVMPLYSFIQSKREQILKLFGTFDSQKLEMKILQLNTLYYQTNNSLKKGSFHFSNKVKVPIQNKYNEKQVSKKQILSQTSSLPKIKRTLLIMTAICYGLSIIYPLLNQFITSKFTEQGKYNTELMANIFEIQTFIHGSIAQNYFCLILKGFPNKKSFNITQQTQQLQQMYDQGKTLLVNLQKTVEEQHQIKRYEQNLYDQFLFKVLENDICTALETYTEYITEENLFPLDKCKTIRTGILKKGLQISLKKFLEFFPDMISLYQINDKDVFIKQFKNYQAVFNYSEFNTFSNYLAKVIGILRYFIIKNSESYYNYMKLFQIALLLYQLFIMILIFYFGWFTFYKFLDHSLFQTKLLLSVMDVNSLLDNSYIYNYLKKNVDL